MLDKLYKIRLYFDGWTKYESYGKWDRVYGRGCMFCFFKLTEGDNPPIYFYNESGEGRFIKVADSLVDFLKWNNKGFVIKGTHKCFI